MDNAAISYARIGEQVHLSPPAVHERVKRLRQRGVIQRSSALLDADSIGKPLLTFVHIEADGWGPKQQLMQIAELPEVEEIHLVTGDSCMSAATDIG